MYEENAIQGEAKINTYFRNQKRNEIFFLKKNSDIALVHQMK